MQEDTWCAISTGAVVSMKSPHHSDLMDVIFDPEVKHVFDLLTELFGVRAVLYDSFGNELLSGGGKSNCEFCHLIQTKLGQLQNCLSWDDKQRKQAAESKGVHPYICHAGVNESIMAVYDKDTLLGYVLIGQYRSREKPEQHLRKAWAKKYANNKIDKLFSKIPQHSAKQIRHIESLFESLVKMITNQRLIEVYDRNPLQILIARMRQAPEEQLSLRGASIILGKSQSTVSHLFTKHYQTGFKQVQLRIRLERACQLLEQDLSLQIQDISEQVGFTDALYFSRQFKKHLHMSPSAYRAAHS